MRAAAGAIRISSDDVSIISCNFTNCGSTQMYGGGAICAKQVNAGSNPVSRTVISDCIFDKCYSTGIASCIEMVSLNCKVENSIFKNSYVTSNSNYDDGGAIVFNKATVSVVNNCSFINLTSNEPNGAAIGAMNPEAYDITIQNSYFENCTAANGASIYMSSKECTVKNCVFNNNHGDYGSVFYSNNPSNLFLNCSGVGNRAKQGIFYVKAASNLIEDCNFRDNFVSNCDIIYLNGNNNKLLNSVFVNNTSPSTILSCSGSGVVVNNNIIIENRGTNILYSSTSNGMNADYNWFGNSEDNYNERPQCNNYNNVKITKWYYLNLMANQSIVAQNQLYL